MSTPLWSGRFTAAPDAEVFAYGKSLSIEHWEETCDYYIKHFPFDTYGRKWTERKGKAIHTESDFGRQLYEWGETLFANAVKLER